MERGVESESFGLGNVVMLICNVQILQTLGGKDEKLKVKDYNGILK
jgi:hypothetical protein